MSLTESIRDTISRCLRELKTNPQPKSFSDLADAYRKQGDLDKALDVVKHGAQRYPHSLPLTFVMAQVEFDRGNAKVAKNALEEVLRVSQDHLKALKMLAYILYVEKDKAAIDLIERIITLDPDDKVAIRHLQELKKIETNEPVNKDNESDSIDSKTLAEMYKRQGHKEEALKIYRNLLKKEPDNDVFQKEIAALENKESSPVVILTSFLEKISSRRRA
ncbi:MAG: tetratricopeptide repeat protein [Bdellovibrionales bacterium]|nr:tetratricopeptide repeat protein [Bdellovibrionales bacterium]